jgi:hypothetical protein
VQSCQSVSKTQLQVGMDGGRAQRERVSEVWVVCVPRRGKVAQCRLGLVDGRRQGVLHRMTQTCG